MYLKYSCQYSIFIVNPAKKQIALIVDANWQNNKPKTDLIGHNKYFVLQKYLLMDWVLIGRWLMLDYIVCYESTLNTTCVSYNIITVRHI